MKKLLSISLLLLATTLVFAEPQLSLVILLNDNSQIVYPLSDQPQVTFSKNQMTVKTKTLEVSYPEDKIVRYTYESRVPTKVTNISNDSQINLQNDMLLFENLQQGSTITIFTAAGMLVLQCQTSHQGTYALPVETLSQGVYLIKVNSLTYKILKR